MTKEMLMDPDEKATRISLLLEKLDSMEKGERSLKGRKIRRNLRALGFYLSKVEKKVEAEEN